MSPSAPTNPLQTPLKQVATWSAGLFGMECCVTAERCDGAAGMCLMQQEHAWQARAAPGSAASLHSPMQPLAATSGQLDHPEPMFQAFPLRYHFIQWKCWHLANYGGESWVPVLFHLMKRPEEEHAFVLEFYLHVWTQQGTANTFIACRMSPLILQDSFKSLLVFHFSYEKNPLCLNSFFCV